MQASFSKTTAKGFLAACAVAATLSLGGCGGVDGVGLNGAVFDWMGISESAMSKKSADPKVAERAPLVLPPSTASLPEPGSGRSADTADINFPNDPEQKKIADAKKREQEHLAYCRGEKNWQGQVLKPEDPANRKSPYGPCPSLGNMVKINTN